MCVVSMVGDHYDDVFRDKYPHWYPSVPNEKPFIVSSEITREEFDELKRQVDEMVKLLKRAKLYDIENDEPDCEIEEKMEKLRKVAELVDVDLDEVLRHVGEKDGM